LVTKVGVLHEESPKHDEGDAGHDHDDDTGSGGGGEDTDTQTLLTSALRDPHVQELLLKERSNAKAAAREKDKLEQMEKDGKILYPGCRPGDTCLNVTLKALEMKVQHKWTDFSFDDNLEYWHEKLPEGNTLPRSTEEAKKLCALSIYRT
jgi:hypothetical protein